MANKKSNKKKASVNTSVKEVSAKKDITSVLEKYPLAILVILISIIITVVYKDFIFQKFVYLFTDIGSDSLNVYYPGYYFYVDNLWKPGIRAWSFQHGMGQGVYTGVVKDPFVLLLALGGAKNIASNIIYIEILKIFSAGIIFYYYSKTLNLSKFSSVLGGVVIAFMGYLILGGAGWYGHSTGVVYSLLLLLAFEKFYKEKSWYLLPIAVLLFGPFKLYLNVVFIAVYSVVRILLDNKFNLKESIYFYFKFLITGLLGFLMGIFFSLGSILKLLSSPRGSGEVSTSLKAGDNLSMFDFAPPDHNATAILRFFSNDILGTGSNYKGWYNYLEAPIFYVGLLFLLLVPVLFSLVKKRQIIIYASILLVWLIPVIFPYFRYALYLNVGDYYKSGMSFFVPFLIAFLGIIALDKVFTKKVNPYVVWGAFVFFLMVLYYNYFDSIDGADSVIDKEIRGSILKYLFIYAVLISLTRVEKIKPYIKYALIITVCFEAASSSNITVNEREALRKEDMSKKIGYNDYTVEAFDFVKQEDDSFFRVNKNYLSNYTKHLTLNDAKVQGYYGTSSYSSANHINYVRFLREVGVIRPNVEYDSRWSMGLMNKYLLHGMASIKYNFVKGDLKYSKSKGYDFIASFGDVNVLKNNYYLPLGYTYDKYITIDNYRKLSKEWKDLIFYSACVVDTVDETLSGLTEFDLNDTLVQYTWSHHSNIIESRKSSVLEMKSFTDAKIEGTINSPSDRILFFSFPYDKGWKAYVDDNEVDISAVNMGLVGLPISSGDHKVELKYSVPYINLGILTSVIATLIYILGILISKNIIRLPFLKSKAIS